MMTHTPALTARFTTRYVERGMGVFVRPPRAWRRLDALADAAALALAGARL